MTSAFTDGAWDFGPVYDLIHSFAKRPPVKDSVDFKYPPNKTESYSVTQHEPKAGGRDDASDGEGVSLGLGDFRKIWDHLGVQHDLPAPKIPTFEASTTSAAAGDTQAVYTSDGALYYPASSKVVRWKQDEDAGAETAIDADEETDANNENMTKNQKRKLRRRKNKLQATPNRDIGVVEALMLEKQGVWSGSDTESVIKTPTKKSGKGKPEKVIPKAQTTAETSKKVNGYQSEATPAKNRYYLRSREQPQKNQAEMNGKSSTVKAKAQENTAGPGNGTAASKIDQKNKKSFVVTEQPATELHAKLQKQFAAFDNGALAFTPTSVIRSTPTRATAPPEDRPQERKINIPPVRSKDDLKHLPSIVTTRPLHNQRSYDLAPLQPRDDLNWVLFKKLLTNFPEDRTHLVSALQMSINRPTPNGVHVFVDASNILIGFQHQLKQARGIPSTTYLPRRPDLHFHALALLLERRRPVSKRVLAGSAPEIPAFEQAREVGYETCILDKVFKAKELTKRQQFFAARDAKRAGYKSGNESSGDALSYEDTATLAKAKWVEQAVDEILHLKMLESIVDTQIVPSVQAPIMILATGDAAEAEYSSGFLCMVMRALHAGWRVELVSWAANISSEYRKLESQQAWKDKFTVVELDGYCEELFSEAL